jgi:hypothetical protein
MTPCDLDIVLYFYDEMAAVDRARAAAHLRGCEACRQRLEDLHAIREALAARPAVEAPPAGDWSGFMHRLDGAVGMRVPSAPPAPVILERSGRTWTARHVVALAATLALVVTGVFMAARFRAQDPSERVRFAPNVVNAPQNASAARAVTAGPTESAPASERDQSLREVSVEHLERSKLVVLGLTTRDPERTSADDWQYERRLAGTLLSDTRLYRMAAQDRGVADVARVMRDLETVLLEASLSDSSDRGSLKRLQRLIAKRDLVMKMQVMATSGSAGI